MGYRAISTRRASAASAVSSEIVVVNTGAGFSAVGSTVSANTAISLGATVAGQTTAQSTTAGGSGGSSISIASIQYLDTNNAVISGDIAVSTLGGNILINGTGFVANSSVYVNNTLVSNTFISSTQVRAILPAASAGNVALMIFTPTLSGTILPNGIRYSGSPTWTTAAVSFQNGSAANVSLVASSDSTLTYTLQAGSTLPTGISLNSAGYLAGTATGYSGTTSSTAVIVATDLEGQATQQTLNITVTTNDPQFPYTTLLLNGETSVTPFIADASTNNFGLTIAGDTKATKFTPYRGDGYYSNLFNGSSDKLSVPASSTLAFGAGDFTIETWFYINGTQTQTYGHSIAGTYDGGSNGGWGIVANRSTDSRAIAFVHANAWQLSYYPSAFLATNQWYHVAVVRSGTAMTMYLNGVSVATATYSATDAVSATCYVGSQGASSCFFPGYISNLRMVKGTAVYTGAFTPSTTPLTAVANTQLLTCQSNRFVDKSTNAAVVTATGTTVSPAIPFAANSNYATYGSAYFDGTGDILTIPDSPSLELGSSNFTIEFWINLSSSSGQSVILAHRASDVTNGPLAIFRTSGTSNLVLYLATGSSGWDIFSGSAIATVSVGQWAHVSICRSGSTFYSSINGVVSTLGTSSSTVGDGTSAWSIGGDLNNNYTNGYISDLRIIKGTALYTTNFTPPTSPLSAVANTQLLALQYNGGANNYGIIDNGPFNNAITRYGNATQGTFSPYAQTGWSINYPALAYMTYAANPIGTFGAGATFTVEGWVNMTTYAATNYFFSLLASCDQATATYWAIGIGSTGLATVYWYDGATKSCAGSTVLTKGTWYHVAVNVTAGVVKIYINGNAETLTGTTTLTNPTGNSSYTTGCERGSSNGGSSGYISNLRTNTGALYPSAFTPSTTALTNVANTTLLTAQSNRYVDNSSSARVITPFATTPPSIQAYSPFAPATAYSPATNGGSAYFDGTGDYLSLPFDAKYDITASDFTVEAWVYRTASAEQYIIHQRPPSSSNGWAFEIYTGNVLRFYYTGGSAIVGTATIPLNAWTHVAATRSGTAFKTFVNGAVDANTTISSGTAATGSLYVGTDNTPGSTNMTGYLSDVRLIKGTALYTGAFTPPTAPLSTPTTYPASLLLNMTNGGIVDAHSTNVFETVAGVQVSTATKKYGNASMYFPNTASNALQFPASNQSIAFGTGDFTVECWVNFATNNATYNPFVRYDGSAFDFGYDFSVSQLKYSGSAAIFAVSQTFTLGTWYHVALTRASGSSRLFVNGTQVGTTVTGDVNNYAAGAFKVGGSSFNAGHIMSGYIDDLRVTRGLARYTANFTPPTSGVLGQ